MSKGLISIYYGTETGNSRMIAEELAAQAVKLDVSASVHDLVNVTAEEFAKETVPCVIVISTWNRGLPPYFARRFCAELEACTVPMPNVRYAVIALGDEHYENFCACGKAVDAALAKLGATRILPRTDLGSSFKREFAGWGSKFWDAIQTSA
jgi:sulfite reductase (NADPH) flavoprotein alpha-component